MNTGIKLKRFNIFSSLMLIAVQSYAAPATENNSPPPSKITSGFGIKLDEDIRPHLEGHYSNISIYVKGLENLDEHELTYMTLNSAVDMKEVFPGARIKYYGLANENYETVQLLADINTGWVCQQDEKVFAIRDLLRTKYKVLIPHEKGHVLDETYTDGKNKLQIECDGNFKMTFTSFKFDEYLNFLKKRSSEKNENLKKKINDLI